jgi:hypothetical protein
VSPTEAVQLKATFDARMWYSIPNCQHVVRVVRWGTPDLPEPRLMQLGQTDAVNRLAADGCLLGCQVSGCEQLFLA